MPAAKISNVPSLKQFLLRQQVLTLYRSFLKLTKEVSDKSQRHELTVWIKQDFQANKHHTDEDIIKMHLSRGKKAIKQMQNTVTLPRVK